MGNLDLRKNWDFEVLDPDNWDIFNLNCPNLHSPDLNLHKIQVWQIGGSGAGV